MSENFFFSNMQNLHYLSKAQMITILILFILFPKIMSILIIISILLYVYYELFIKIGARFAPRHQLNKQQSNILAPYFWAQYKYSK